MMIKEFGGKVASIWEGLRPVTKKMLVGALKAGNAAAASQSPRFYYDAHADWEVSRLLSALDEQSSTTEVRKDTAKLNEIKELAETCVRVLEAQSASAEVFIQLASRAVRDNDYSRLDKLADTLAARYSAGEIAEIVRQTELAQVRAIAYETLAMLPVETLLPLLDDPLYSGIGAGALEQKAYEFDSDEARDVLEQFDADSGQ
ncbi:MAG TPA: hypothetical protein VGO43_10520 [Pyrinomonadaceae bacterium]|jgi:hypothetical protein|nr:hypothetical protein [Pyrinomonadaceae bacterium]